MANAMRPTGVSPSHAGDTGSLSSNFGGKDYFTCLATGKCVPGSKQLCTQTLHIRAVDAISGGNGCYWAEAHTLWDERSNSNGNSNDNKQFFLFTNAWESFEHHVNYMMSEFSVTYLDAALSLCEPNSIKFSKWILKGNPFVVERVYPSRAMLPSEVMADKGRIMDQQRHSGALVAMAVCKPHQEHQEKYLQYLWTSEVMTRPEAGCLGFDVHIGAEEENAGLFAVLFTFKTMEDFNFHSTMTYSMFHPQGKPWLQYEPEMTFWRRHDLPP
jgi:quinol monooxygenase YgiN